MRYRRPNGRFAFLGTPVRTTLKRGIGRGAAFNGNGRAALPPASATPLSRYRQPAPPGGWRIAGRILGWIVVVVLVLALGLLGGAYLFFHESVAAVRAHSRDVTDAQKRLDVAPPGHAAIALVIGYDKRAGEEAGLSSRSDTIMLLRADPRTKSVSMLSFPRDLTVDIHCPGATVYRAKINAAYSQCGSKGTLETVRALTGLPINYLITVDFRGFKLIVNRLGGVWVDVDRRYFNDNKGVSPAFGYATINLRPGYQRLTGGSALNYVRYRHTDSDLYRVARQQLFVEAMKAQFARSFSLTNIPKLVGAITHNVEVGVGGGKELSGKTVLSYSLFAYGLPPGHFFQARIGGLQGYSDLYTDPSNIQAAVQDFVTPDVAAPRDATASALRENVRRAVPKPDKTTVVTLNGSGRLGDGSTAASLLRDRGYNVIDPPSGATGNAPRFGYDFTEVYYNPKLKGAKAAAAPLVKLFAPARASAMPAIIRPLSNGAMDVVVVGTTFHGKIAPAPPDRTPEQQTPSVYSNREATEPLVRKAQKQVPFALEVPTVLEQTSIPDPELPVHAYTLEKGRKAVRLTFRTGGREYWGVQMMNWEDAPVLVERNIRRTLGGRRFDLYFSGGHLHMVVLRENDATYWVVNTLLNSLSNETMIAIAKGLRPL